MSEFSMSLSRFSERHGSDRVSRCHNTNPNAASADPGPTPSIGTVAPNFPSLQRTSRSILLRSTRPAPHWGVGSVREYVQWGKTAVALALAPLRLRVCNCRPRCRLDGGVAARGPPPCPSACVVFRFSAVFRARNRQRVPHSAVP